MSIFEYDEERHIQMERAAARADGFEEGREAGLAVGLEEGREAGLAEGLEEGREAGRAEGLEEGREAGRAEGLEEGRKESREEAIRILIETCESFGISGKAIMDSLKEKFLLPEEAAREAMEKYGRTEGELG